MRKISANLRGACIVALVGVCWSGSTLAQSFTPPPNTVGTTLEACRNGGNVAITPTGTLPNADGRFVCQDPAPLGGNDNPYTTGNLSKDWSELDLVPHRLILTNAGAAATYNVIVAADYQQNGILGYDVITAPEIIPAGQLNGFSAAGCSVSSTAYTTVPDVTGGAGQSIVRTLTITHPAGTQQNKSTCVVDFAMRLAVGAKGFSGSSLQSYKFENTDYQAGKATISLPVREIAPQELAKTMSASQNEVTAWNLTKEANPGEISFGNVCKATSFEKPVDVTVTWTKVGTSPSGDVTVLTNINVKNPATRSITVNVTDKVYTGQDSTGTLLGTQSFSDTVAAGFNGLFKTFTYVIPASQAGNIGQWLNDVATATYTDQATGVAVPGTTTATAKTQIQKGTTLYETANIDDTEEITGLGLKFKVGVPSVGSFVGYTAGDPTTSVTWQVAGLTESGSITFKKTVVLDGKRITSGELTDSATLVSTDNQYTVGPIALIPVTISSSAQVELTIVKKIPIALKTGEKVVTKFTVTPAGGSPSDVYVTHTGPTAIGASAQTTLTGLDPKSYTVAEVESIYYASASDTTGTKMPWVADFQQQNKDLSPKTGGVMDDSNCAGTLTFVNSYGGDPVQAQVKKVTLPALPSTDPDYTWTFKLYGPNGAIEEKTANAGGAFVKFDFVITEEGTYWIEETLKSKWDLYGIVQPDGSSSTNSKCSFVVDFPAAYTQTPFSCTFTNRKRGEVKLEKTVLGAKPSGDQAFSFQLRQGASSIASGATLETKVANAANEGKVSFTTLLVPGQTYQFCEEVKAGWMTTLGTFVPAAFMPPDGYTTNPNVDNSILCVNFSVTAGETKTFTVDNSPPPGGRALTIGFWKNHASCVGPLNKYNPTALDEALYGKLPSGILLSSKIDSLVFADHTTFGLYGQYAKATADCGYAVSLLDKRTFGGSKMASDPLFNMVAQLVATELNLASGAYTCGAVTTAVIQAEALLAKYSFTGNGYKNAQNKQQLSAADASLANTLATTLDNYNNNRAGVCP